MYQRRVTSNPRSVEATIFSIEESPPPKTRFMGASPYSFGSAKPCPVGCLCAAAKAAHKQPTGHGFALPNEYGEAPMNLVFGGGDSSIEKMVASTERGLLVTRLWYIREVDPYEKVMTR